MKRISQNTNEQRITEELHGSIYSFVSWEANYIGNRTPVRLNCKIHGDWTVYMPDIFRGVRCAKCKKVKRRTQEEAMQEIVNQCEKMGLKFLKFLPNYSNAKSKVLILCSNNHRWVTTYCSIVNSKSSCPVCCVNGFKPQESAVIYVLKSTDSKYLKVGITNNHKRRLTELRKATPFVFEVLRVIPKILGSEAREVEKVIHSNFQSASLSGFNGATEWLSWNPQILSWLDYL